MFHLTPTSHHAPVSHTGFGRTSSTSNPHPRAEGDLSPFVQAQQTHRRAIDGGLSTGLAKHISVVFPQLKALGNGPTSAQFGMQSLREASAFLNNPTLEKQLRRSLRDLESAAFPGQGGSQVPVKDVLGSEHATQRLWASLTLLAQATGDKRMQRALHDHFGAYHPKTMDLLRAMPDWKCRPTSVDPSNLERFVDRDPDRIDRIVDRLGKGKATADAKAMAYIFPRMRAPHENRQTNALGLADRREVDEFCSHPVLRRNLKAAMNALLDPRNARKSASEILGPSAKHVQASMNDVRVSANDTELMLKADAILTRFFSR